MKKIIATIFLAIGFIQPAIAASLGKLELQSSLYEPLEALIPLMDTDALSETEILVELGTKEDFKRSGIERTFYYQSLQFRVDMEHEGGPVIKVLTQDAIKEPYLNFVIAVTWPAGRVTREYTVLMPAP